MPRKTILCRCEDVTLEEIQASIAHGMRDIETLKRFHALGTGPCQGKGCLANLAQVLAAADVPIGEIKPMASRPPVAWAPLGIFAGKKEGEA